MNDSHTFRVPIRVDAIAAYSQAQVEIANGMAGDIFVRMGELVHEAREAMFARSHAADVLHALGIDYMIEWPDPGPGSHFAMIHIADPRQAAQFKISVL